MRDVGTTDVLIWHKGTIGITNLDYTLEVIPSIALVGTYLVQDLITDSFSHIFLAVSR